MVIRWRKRGRSGEPVPTSEPAERVYGARGRAVVFVRSRSSVRTRRPSAGTGHGARAHVPELKRLNAADLVVRD